jgi:hypothetical protein
MAPWTLPPHSESEVCYVSYYDVTDQVPAQFRGPSGTTLRFNRQLTTQDPASHHLVTNFYKGDSPPNDPVWGHYACRSGPHDGEDCDPVNLGACGAGFECATDPVKSIACIGFGPADTQITISSLGFGGSQQTVSHTDYAPGVYAEIPLKGLVLLNSHAFDLTDQPGTLE